jgi:hypothetical protein
MPSHIIANYPQDAYQDRSIFYTLYSITAVTIPVLNSGYPSIRIVEQQI